MEKKKVRVGIVVDPVSGFQTPEDEISDILAEISGWDIEPELIVQGTGMHVVSGKSLDMLIIDYGGMSYGAGDTASWQVKEALQWAQDHPGKLVILWTEHTQRIYKWEFEELFGSLKNVMYRFSGESFRHEGIEPRVREWLGVPPADWDGWNDVYQR